MTNTYLSRLVEELDRGEEKLSEAAEALRLARAEYDVQALKYAAVRDAANETYLPYTDTPYRHAELWPDDSARGRFRFIRMSAGDAALLALREANEPMTLQELAVFIRAGGAQFDGRALNGALQQKGGIKRIESEGDEPTQYAFDEEADQMPF